MEYEDIVSTIESMHQGFSGDQKSFSKKMMDTLSRMFLDQKFGALDLCHASVYLDGAASKEARDILIQMSDQSRKRMPFGDHVARRVQAGEDFDDVRHDVATQILAEFVERKNLTIDELDEALFSLGTITNRSTYDPKRPEELVIQDIPAFWAN